MQQQVERDAVAAIPTVALEHEFRLVLGRTVPVDQSGGVGGSKQRLGCAGTADRTVHARSPRTSIPRETAPISHENHCGAIGHGTPIIYIMSSRTPPEDHA